MTKGTIYMKISVKANEFTTDRNPNLRGYATVKFDEDFVLDAFEKEPANVVLRR